VEEVHQFFPHLSFKIKWVETTGDIDQKTSLRRLEKTDFFTRELDQMLLDQTLDLAVHSAKDLPDPLPRGLKIVAITKGQDPRDCIVLRDGEKLFPGAKIATSSVRREEAAKLLYPDLQFVDLRGTIGERLRKLETGEADGVIVAEAALIRLKMHSRNRIYLPGETAPLQGRLALVAREKDELIFNLFSSMHDDTLPRP
jgi:hydroxymethylbilane synthase